MFTYFNNVTIPPNPVTIPPNPVLVPVPVCCDDSQIKVNIVDTNGEVLGEMLGGIGTGATITAIELNGKKYILKVSKHAIMGAFTPTFFSNNNCTGQAYFDKTSVEITMAIPSSVAPADASIDPTNETLYEADLDSLVNETFNSFWNSGLDQICEMVSDTRDLYEANPVFDLSSLFEPPYTFQ